MGNDKGVVRGRTVVVHGALVNKRSTNDDMFYTQKYKTNLEWKITKNLSRGRGEGVVDGKDNTGMDNKQKRIVDNAGVYYSKEGGNEGSEAATKCRLLLSP